MPPTSNAHWLRKSAERGNAEAQFMYALMHANGRGVPKDRLAAYFWLLLASTQLPSLASRARDEVARYLGGVANVVAPEQNEGGADPLSLGDTTADKATYRPVTIINPGTTKKLLLRVELPIEVSRGEPVDAANASIWAAIHPRLLQLVREHRSTLIFVNSRRIAERLAGALNELAAETLVFAHHGSLAPDQRAQIENQLKAGLVRGLVATSHEPTQP